MVGVASADPPKLAVRLKPVEVQAATLKPKLMNGAQMRYGTGPLEYEVEVQNPNNMPVDTTLKLQHANVSTPLLVPIRATPGQSTVLVSDPRGLDDCIMDLRWSINDGSTLQTAIDGKCTFTFTPTDPSAGVPGDRKVEAQENRLTHYNGRIVSEGSCSGNRALRYEVTVKNKSNIATRAELDVDPPYGVPRMTKRLQFDIAPGETKTLSGFGFEPFKGDPGLYSVALRDTQGKVQSYNSGWGAMVARVCLPEQRPAPGMPTTITQTGNRK
jgi:hypothetical protein